MHFNLRKTAALVLPVVLATSLAGCNDASGGAAPDAPTEPAADLDPATVEAEIWKKEEAIFEGRSRGDASYYADNASENYLAWVYGSDAPFDLTGLKEGAKSLVGKDQEVSELTKTGFSLSGDTAIMYFQNNRTRTPDGEVVDEVYDNIHVWQLTDDTWKVLASMSRKVK